MFRYLAALIWPVGMAIILGAAFLTSRRSQVILVTTAGHPRREAGQRPTREAGRHHSRRGGDRIVGWPRPSRAPPASLSSRWPLPSWHSG